MWAAIENDDKLRKKVLGGLKGCDEKSLAADHLASLPQQFSSCQSRQITLSYTSYDLYPRADEVQRFGEPSGEDGLQWNGEPHVQKVATEWDVPCLGLQIVACWGHRLPGCNLFRKKVATNIQAATGNPTLLPSQAWRGEGILSTIAIEKLAAKRAR